MNTTDDTENQPCVSIIIATLNVERTLNKCIESILHQTAINKVEILIKDGGSTDETVCIIKKHDKYISYWESSADTGTYDAWNSILPRASGKWILFLGADDVLFDNHVIANVLSILQKTTSPIDIAYGKVRLVSKDHEKIIDLGKDWEKTKNCIKEKMCIPHQGIFHRSSLFIEHGKYNTDYSISADYDFIRRFILEGNIQYLDMIITCMGAGGISTNPRNTLTRLKEIRQINQNHGSRFPGKLWLITFINTCFRNSLFLLIGEKSGKYVLDLFRGIAGLPRYWTKI